MGEPLVSPIKALCSPWERRKWGRGGLVVGLAFSYPFQWPEHGKEQASTPPCPLLVTDQPGRQFRRGSVARPPRHPPLQAAFNSRLATKAALLDLNVQVLSHDGSMSPVLDRKETALKLARSRGLLRAKEAAAAGVDRSTLARLCESGLLERLERGLYGLPSAAVREHVDLEIVAKRVPQAVFCLLTALRLHGLGTQQPRRVWICLPRGTHTPTLQFPPLQVIHVEAALHRQQRQAIRSGPIRLKVYGVEKTLVDCFRYRQRLGMEPVLEALKDAISQRRLNVDELWRQAQAQRMQRVMAPYLEALL